MSKKLIGRGRHTVLPIVGETVQELKLGRMTALVFSAEGGPESDVVIEEAIILIRGSHERVLEGSKPGETWNPNELGPLLELIGCTVIDALAEQEGTLQITFSNNLVLKVVPTTGYEAWHFRYPLPGASGGGKPGVSITLIGAGGWLSGGVA
jgi:hypothetical protein